MTTIVYDHKNKQIAVDSRTCGGGVIRSDTTNKIDKKGDLIFVLAGSLDDKEHLISRYPEDLTRKVSCSGFLIKDKITYGVCGDDLNIAEWEMNYSDAHGSGEHFALSALDHNKSAKDCVEYAKTRDLFTGGKVHVFDIEKNEFI